MTSRSNPSSAYRKLWGYRKVAPFFFVYGMYKHR
nr:MAG TPA: hypothetical protein [Caudoviricetes sp.]